MLRPAVTLIALLCAVAVGAGPGDGAWLPSARAAEVLDVPLPRGARSAGGHLFTSSRGFRRTVEFYKRFFKRTGLAHDPVPVYAYRGTVVARFLSRQPGTRWAAVHVFRHEGRTMIYVVPADPLTADETHGKEASP